MIKQKFSYDRPKYVTIDTKIPLVHIIDWIEEDPTYINKVENKVQDALIWLFPERFLWSGVRITSSIRRKLIEACPRLIIDMDSPSTELQLLAIGKNPALAKAIKNPCEEIKSYLALVA